MLLCAHPHPNFCLYIVWCECYLWVLICIRLMVLIIRKHTKLLFMLLLTIVWGGGVRRSKKNGNSKKGWFSVKYMFKSFCNLVNTQWLFFQTDEIFIRKRSYEITVIWKNGKGGRGLSRKFWPQVKEIKFAIERDHWKLKLLKGLFP